MEYVLANLKYTERSLHQTCLKVPTEFSVRYKVFLFQNLEKTYNEQVARGSPSAVAVYSYAHGLIRSDNSNVQKGIKLLEG